MTKIADARNADKLPNPHGDHLNSERADHVRKIR